jgi:hypothetical protein
MRARYLNLLLVAAAVLAAGSAQASPINYLFTSGQVTITATVLGNPIAGPAVVAMNGSSVVIDESVLQLTSVNFSAGSSAVIPITGSYGGYTSIHIDFATLSAALGSLSVFDVGPPTGYNYSIGPVGVAGQFDAVNVNPIFNVNNAPFGFSNPSASGQVYVDTGASIAMDGITLGTFDPDGPGPLAPIVLKGDFLFEAAVPEPGTAVLFGIGLAGVAARRRARAS